MSKSTVLWVALLAFAVFFVMTEPASAAHVVKAAWAGTVHVMQGLSEFAQRLGA